MLSDTIQETIAARAKKLGLSAYAIAKAIRGNAADGEKCPTEETVKRYLDARCALNSRYVSAICEVLDLQLIVKAD